ncbi:hypothetical protein L3Q82_001497 [Scortum barcoo]|uniref:Uncharacterized protein n=1 Tax=Scortum barcoo TaxID=214431 RepID=A0ACB8W848_9TELE|nr:hypothetical protein L3Q82_001497 [Scortum barcoo]
MPPGRLPREVFQACPTGRRPRWKTQDTLERLCLSAGLGTPQIPPEELEEVSGMKPPVASPHFSDRGREGGGRGEAAPSPTFTASSLIVSFHSSSVDPALPSV